MKLHPFQEIIVTEVAEADLGLHRGSMRWRQDRHRLGHHRGS